MLAEISNVLALLQWHKLPTELEESPRFYFETLAEKRSSSGIIHHRPQTLTQRPTCACRANANANANASVLLVLGNPGLVFFVFFCITKFCAASGWCTNSPQTKPQRSFSEPKQAGVSEGRSRSRNTSGKGLDCEAAAATSGFAKGQRPTERLANVRSRWNLKETSP